MSRTADPLVSVCLPAYNAARWIRAAIGSALEQTHSDLEVVVVDNASTDDTVEQVLQISDPRVRLYSNSRNLGVYGNYNRSLSLARGRYLKFHSADDRLYPDCVEAMLERFRADDRVGLVFSPRDIVLEDPTDPSAAKWKSKHENTHERFGELGEVNDGGRLLARWAADGFGGNWIGEQTNVMMSRECLDRVGTFPLRMCERGDQELWARAMLAHAIGFVDRPLSSYLVHSGSLSGANRETGEAWLDPLWLLEGLLSYDAAARRYPDLARLRRRTLLRTARKALQPRRPPPAREKLAALARYLAFRVRSRRGAVELHGSMSDGGQPGETVPVTGPVSVAEAI